MRKPAALMAIGQLLGQPFFTAAEAKKLGVSTSHLAHYVNTGKIRRLGRGIYQGVDYQAPVESFHWEDLMDAVHSVPGGVICLISALAIYEITEEIPRQHWIAVSHRTSIKKRPGVKIVRFRDINLGQVKMNLGGVQVPIFDRERTIIDAFRLLSRETAVKALKMALFARVKPRLDLKKLQVCARELRVNIGPYLITAMT